MICYATRFKFLIVLAGYMNLPIHIDRVWSLRTTTCRAPCIYGTIRVELDDSWSTLHFGAQHTLNVRKHGVLPVSTSLINNNNTTTKALSQIFRVGYMNAFSPFSCIEDNLLCISSYQQIWIYTTILNLIIWGTYWLPSLIVLRGINICRTNMRVMV